jgi:hypothetical protein
MARECEIIEKKQKATVHNPTQMAAPNLQHIHIHE